MDRAIITLKVNMLQMKKILIFIPICGNWESCIIKFLVIN